MAYPKLERQTADRFSFRLFLGTTEIVPDFTTVWMFRERLAKSGKDKEVWEELQGPALDPTRIVGWLAKAAF